MKITFARRFKRSVVRRCFPASLSGQAERCAICRANLIVPRSLRHHHRPRSRTMPNRSPLRSISQNLGG
jgi:hypothetical protein